MTLYVRLEGIVKLFDVLQFCLESKTVKIILNKMDNTTEEMIPVFYASL